MRKLFLKFIVGLLKTNPNKKAENERFSKGKVQNKVHIFGYAPFSSHRQPFYKQTTKKGLAVSCWAGKRKDLGSNLLRLSFPFKSYGLWTLSCDFVPHNYETLKWLSSLPTLM